MGMIFFRWANEVKTIKKKITKNGTLFSPEFKWRPALRCTPESNYWGEADVDHTLIIGGRDTVKIIGGYVPPWVSAPLLKAKDQDYRCKCSPKTKQKKVPQNLFQAISKKAKKKSEQIFRKVSEIFQPSFDLSKSIVLSSAKDMAIFEDLRLRGQGQRLDLWRQSQGLRNESSRPKDVLEDSISGNYIEPMLTPHHELVEEKSEQKR